MIKVFSSMYSAKTKKKSDIFFFFFCAAAIKISRSSLLIYIYIFWQEQNKIKNLGVYADFDQ